MLEFLRDKELIEANPFETAKIKKLHFLPAFGVNPSDYGGRVKHIAELQDKDILLIIDKSFKTIDVARLKKEEEAEVEVKRFTCKKCNEEFENQGHFLAHSRKCK